MRHVFYAPDEIPLHYFYFGWKKAKSFVKQQGFYDPIEIKEFELELEKNLRKIRNRISSLSYEMAPPIAYGFPKGRKDDQLRLRPMSKVSFIDQVAWATIVLVLGEWFDTINDGDEEVCDLEWMVNWSCNNRLRRKYYPTDDENNFVFRRLMVNYTHNELYESFQRSLRFQRKKQEDYFEQILDNSPYAYYGQADITKFYPSLRMDIVREVLFIRLNQLCSRGITSVEVVKKWEGVLFSLCKIKTNNRHLSEIEVKAIGTETVDLLIDCLPTGLIASGFLANCVLTHYLDIPINEFRIKKTSEGKVTHLTRYTDDIMIISSDEETIYEGIHKIRGLLNSIGLRMSEDKTRPILKEDMIKSITKDIKSLSTTQANDVIEHILQDSIKCPRVGKFDNLPSSTALIDKLSQLGDQHVRAMNQSELEKYLTELMELVNTEFAADEIRDDTKSSFASWKIRKTANDARYRDLDTKQSVTETLKRMYMKYPYKLSLVSCYILHLMEIPFDEKVEELFTEMLKSAKKNDRQDQPGFYGSYMRTHIMFCIAENWKNVGAEIRSKLGAIIQREIMGWYDQDTYLTWHEQYAIYWALSNISINTRGVPMLNESPIELVNRAYRLFRIMDHDVESGNDPVLIALMSEIWRNNRPKNKREHATEDESQWIGWLWKRITSNMKGWEWKNEGHGRVWIEISTGRENVITTYGFRRLMELAELHIETFLEDNSISHNEEYFEISPIFNGVIDILNKSVTKWVEQSNSMFNARFLRAIRMVSKNYKIKSYLMNRLRNLKEIDRTLLSKKNIIGNVPSFTSDKNKIIPLQDWVEIISILPQRLEVVEIPKELLHLTETEITLLLIEVSKRIIAELDNRASRDSNVDIFNSRTLWSKTSLNRIGLSVEDWNKWRNGDLSFGIDFTDDFVIYSDTYLSAWAYTNTFFLDEEFLICYSLSVLLLLLISKKHIYSGAAGIKRLRGWTKISDVIAHSEFPSTVLAEVIAGSLNYQRPFYNYYAEHGGIELPLLPLEKEPIINLADYLQVLEDHLSNVQSRVLIGDTGLREMRFIDLDKIVRG